MNIAIDIRSLQSSERTGVGEYTFELLSALFRLDHENNYYIFSNSYSDLKKILPVFSAPNVHPAHFSFPNKLLTICEIFFHAPKLDRLIERKFNIKLDWWFSPHLNFTSLSPKTRHAITIHDLTFEYFPQFLTAKQNFWHRLLGPKKQCEKAALIFTPSENTKRDLVQTYKLSSSKISVLSPGLSSVFTVNEEQNCHSELSQAKNLPTSNQLNHFNHYCNCGTRKILRSTQDDIKSKYHLPPHFILFLGTIEPRKNIPTLIKAFQMASPQLKDYDLIIAGAKGWKNKNIVANWELGTGNLVHFLGYIPDSNKPALYRAASLFVYPSFYEGFGFPVLEAMASGLPVITSPRSSLPEVCGDAAYYANPHRPEEIALGMTRILSSETLRNEMINKGLEKAREFNWEKTAASWLTTLIDKT